MAVNSLIYCDLYRGVACKSSAADTMTFPTFVAGGKITYGLRFLEYQGSYFTVDQTLASLRVAMGLVDARPATGTYQLQAASGISTAANTTAILQWNAVATEITTALNALSIATGNPFVVTDVPGGYVVNRTDGSAISLSVISNTMRPVSFGQIEAAQIGTVWQYEVRLCQAPLAFTNTAARVVPPAPVITEIQAGGASMDGVTKWNEIQSLSILPSFLGTYQLSLGLAKTELLDVTDGASQLQDALNTMLAPQGAFVTVTNPTTNVANIEFGGSLAGMGVGLLQVSVYSAPPGDWTFSLDLGTYEMLTALWAAGESLQLAFEAEADIYLDPTDFSAGTETVKLWSTTVAVAPPLITPNLESVPEIDWVRPPADTYIPGTTDQILIGNQEAVLIPTIGDGVSDHFPITHNLNSVVPTVKVRQTAAGGKLLSDEAYTVNYDSVNALTIYGLESLITPGSPPAVDEYTVLIEATGPASVFQTHTHTIAQIVGLQTLLDGYDSAISALQSILPTISGAGTTTSATGIPIPLTLKSEILGWPASAVVPAASATTGYSSSQMLNRPPSLLPVGSGGINTDRELWRVAMNPQLLALGRTLQIDWGVALQVLRPNCGMEYQLVVEIGTYASAGSMLNITWESGPVFSQPIVLTEELTVHSFGITIPRGIVGSTDTLQLTQQLYGISSGNNTAAPTSASFAIRCRLIGLETEPSSVQPDPRGWIYLAVVPSLTAATGVTIAQALVATPA